MRSRVDFQRPYLNTNKSDLGGGNRGVGGGAKLSMGEPGVPLIKLVHLTGCLMQLGVVVARKLAANLCDVVCDDF